MLSGGQDLHLLCVMRESFVAYTADGLYNAACTHLLHLENVNEPAPGHVRGHTLPVYGRHCVKAEPRIGVTFNFCSRHVRAMVASDLDTVEGLLDEAWRRASKQDASVSLRHVNVYVELERQARLFLNRLAGTGVLNARDSMNAALDAVQGLYGLPRGSAP